jgi:hypothetical protein
MGSWIARIYRTFIARLISPSRTNASNAARLTHRVLWEEMSEAGLAEVRSPRLGLEEAAGKTAAVYARALSEN